jgi:hypothetical protein
MNNDKKEEKIDDHEEQQQQRENVKSSQTLSDPDQVAQNYRQNSGNNDQASEIAPAGRTDHH